MLLKYSMRATALSSEAYGKILKCFSSCCMQANPELTAVWAVGQRIWQRDFPGIYTAIAAHQWTENILPVMEALRGNDKNHILPDLSLSLLYIPYSLFR